MCYMNRALETCWYAAMGSDRTCDIMSAGHLAYRPLIFAGGVHHVDFQATTSREAAYHAPIRR